MAWRAPGSTFSRITVRSSATGGVTCSAASRSIWMGFAPPLASSTSFSRASPSASTASASKRSVSRCFGASVSVRVPSAMRAGDSADSVRRICCGDSVRLVTSSATFALSPGAMKRGVDSSATMGAATVSSRSPWP